jgi:hypothetical protein
MLARLSKEYGERKVRFVAVSADEWKNRAAVGMFVAAHQLGMEIWLGPDLDMLERADLGNVLPATFVLDEHGEVETVTKLLGWSDARIAGDFRVAATSGMWPVAARVTLPESRLAIHTVCR